MLWDLNPADIQDANEGDWVTAWDGWDARDAQVEYMVGPGGVPGLRLESGNIESTDELVMPTANTIYLVLAASGPKFWANLPSGQFYPMDGRLGYTPRRNSEALNGGEMVGLHEGVHLIAVSSSDWDASIYYDGEPLGGGALTNPRAEEWAYATVGATSGDGMAILLRMYATTDPYDPDVAMSLMLQYGIIATPRVSWQPPVADGGAPITGYVVRHLTDGGEVVERRVDASVLEVDLTVPGGVVQVSAVNVLGESVPAEVAVN